MLVFYDERYRSVLNLPQSAHRQTFSGQEVTGSGGMPSEQRHLREIAEFFGLVHRGSHTGSRRRSVWTAAR